MFFIKEEKKKERERGRERKKKYYLFYLFKKLNRKNIIYFYLFIIYLFIIYLFIIYIIFFFFDMQKDFLCICYYITKNQFTVGWFMAIVVAIVVNSCSFFLVNY